MKNNASLFYSLVLIVGDFLALLAAFSVAYILRVKLDTRPLVTHITAHNYFFAMAAILPLWILVQAFIGLYNSDVYERRFRELGRLFIGSALGILVVIGYDFVAQAKLFPSRLVPIYALIVGFAFLVLFRTLARFFRQSLYTYGFGVSNVLVIGDTPLTDEVSHAIHNTKTTGQRVLAVVTKRESSFKTYTSFAEAIEEIKRPVHSIIQTGLFKNQELNDAILAYAQERHISYRFVPGDSALYVGKISVDLFAGLPMIAVHQTALIGWGRVTKRLFDIFASTVALIIASPFILIIALLEVTIGGGQPVFFRQTRLTRHNLEFRVYKFRTHRNGLSGLSDKEAFAKLGKPELYEKYRDNGYALDKDPRLTALGRFLRKTSLDEIPQLFNVFKGDISLVGPRALIPEELNTYSKKHTILSVKSGLTGLAQVSGRQNISFEERRQLDMYYVQNWSFWGDCIILLKTIRVVLTGLGAK